MNDFKVTEANGVLTLSFPFAEAKRVADALNEGSCGIHFIEQDFPVTQEQRDELYDQARLLGDMEEAIRSAANLPAV